MKLFDKLKMSQRNFNHDKDVTHFVIKSDKSNLFFNQFQKQKNKEESSVNEKLKSFILFPKVLNTWSETLLYIWNNLLSLRNTKMI